MVSIIIPVYNASKYLKNTVNAILSQSVNNWALILIDDCSSDDSYEICKQFALEDDRIVALRTDVNSGPAITRNMGIDYATKRSVAGGADFLSFVDSDDTVTVDYVERLYSKALQFHDDIVWCNYWEYDFGNEQQKILRAHQIPAQEILCKDYLLSLFFESPSGLGSLCNKLYSVDFIKQTGIRLNSERIRAEDWEFNLMLFQKDPKVVAIEDALYNYIHYPHPSIMTTFRSKDYEMFWRSRKLLEEMAKKNNIKFNAKKENNTIIYNIVNHLFILAKAANIIDKQTELQSITTDARLNDLLRNKEWSLFSLPIRFRIAAIFLWLNSSILLKWYLRI